MNLNQRFRAILFPFCLLCLEAVMGQELPVEIQQDSAITKALLLKIEANKEQYANEVYSIQLYYGEYAPAKEILNSVNEKFPELRSEISFETPNYKVQVGPFEAYIEALEQLKLLKVVYKEAFILQPKREL